MKAVHQSQSKTEMVIDQMNELAPDMPQHQRHMLANFEDHQLHLEKFLRRARREQLIRLQRAKQEDERYEREQLLLWLHGSYSVT